jgi:thiol:disulfide interchange protein DsbD
MKKILVIIAITFILSSASHAQVQDPVKWNYVAIKKTDKEYTINISATLEPDWHIYSMNTPDGGPVATVFNFKKNPLITIDGKTVEKGKSSTVHDDIFGVDVKYYSETVTFVQQVILKSAVKTNLSGTVKYMICNDKMCLPPKTVPFNIQIQ